MSTNHGSANAGATPGMRWAFIILLAALAYFASYRYAVAANGSASATGTPSAVASGSGAAAGGGGGGCCGGGAPAGAVTTKKATEESGVQKITVDTSKGYYDPTTIELKAGVPAEITFTQSSGCLAQVQSQQLGFFEDLTGGPKTIKLPALEAGSYPFACGMQMATGTIVVK